MFEASAYQIVIELPSNKCISKVRDNSIRHRFKAFQAKTRIRIPLV